jgi:hypothetical protein
LPFSVVVAWAAEGVNAVSPPKRSVDAGGLRRIFRLRTVRRSCHEGAEVIPPDASWTRRSKTQNSEHEKKQPVTAAEISKDPRQPSRFEKKKNMRRLIIDPAATRP